MQFNGPYVVQDRKRRPVAAFMYLGDAVRFLAYENRISGQRGWLVSDYLGDTQSDDFTTVHATLFKAPGPLPVLEMFPDHEDKGATLASLEGRVR